MNAQEFTDKIADGEHVHDAKALGEVVFVILNSTSSPPYTFEASLGVGWTMVYENQNPTGDVRVYAPMEWFADDNTE